MAKQEKAVTKDMLVRSQVVDAEGRAVGTVKDVAFVVGKMGLSLYVEGKKGESRNITWEEVQAVGDYVVLKIRTSTGSAASGHGADVPNVRWTLEIRRTVPEMVVRQRPEICLIVSRGFSHINYLYRSFRRKLFGDYRAELVDLGAFDKPRIRGQPGFDATLAQERFLVPLPFNGNLG